MPSTMMLQNNMPKILGFLLMAFTALILMISSAFAQVDRSWQNQEFKVKGTWSIEQRADGNYLVVSDDFKTKSAPDLKFFLSKNDYGSITGKNATHGAALVAKLTSTKGGQAYKIPSNINLSDYQSLVLHCEQYSKLWASTPLR